MVGNEKNNKPKDYNWSSYLHKKTKQICVILSVMYVIPSAKKLIIS